MSVHRPYRWHSLGIAIGDRVRVVDLGFSGSGAKGTVVDIVGAIAVVLRDGEPRLSNAELVVPAELLERAFDQSQNPLHVPPTTPPMPFWWRQSSSA